MSKFDLPSTFSRFFCGVLIDLRLRGGLKGPKKQEKTVLPNQFVSKDVHGGFKSVDVRFYDTPVSYTCIK